MKEIQVLKNNDRQKITLCEEGGKKYIRREIQGDKREIYKTLQKINKKGIPAISSVELCDTTVVCEEYIDGVSLSSLMDSGERLSKKDIYSIALQLTNILSALHAENIIHRDIKPDNILIDKSKRIWLIDYDIARIYRPEIRKDTEKMGTFGYAPIEQYGMLPTDFKTDIYSFGVTIQALLDCSNIKGGLYKATEKCKRLDPSQRYQSAGELKRAILISRLKPWLACLLLAVLAMALLPWGNETQTVEEATEATTEVAALPAEPPTEIQLPEDVYFVGFAKDAGMEEYGKYPNYHHVAVFSMYKPWDHLLFLEDVNKKGKIKLGNNTLVDADITLNDGKLKVYLKDEYNHEFTKEFAYEGQYKYDPSYPAERKNADIVCCDMDLDNIPELFIGLNEGCIGVMEGRQFYNNFNYCIAWCIKYDEETGFTLCEGDMFSPGYSFYMTQYARKFNIEWYTWGDITGYIIEDNKIIPVY